MMEFISKLFLVAYGATTHAADCPKPIAFDEGKVPPYMRSIRLPSHCDPKTIYRCRTGVLHVSNGLSYSGTNVVGIECV
ncbi:MAG: Hsp20/alpha crystallin family protein, partial [Bdellovibrionales bacterium]